VLFKFVILKYKYKTTTLPSISAKYIAQTLIDKHARKARCMTTLDSYTFT